MDAINSILIPGLLVVLIWFLKDAPTLLRQLKVEKLRGVNEQHLQIESYFRQVSSKDLNDILKKWLTLIDDLKSGKMSEKKIKEYMKDLTTKTFMYSSSRTTKMLGLMQQLTYENSKLENQLNIKVGEPKEAKADFRLIVYTSFIIASLKEDFTGYKIGPLDFLKLRLNDFNDPEIFKRIKEGEKEILETLKKEGIKWRDE